MKVTIHRALSELKLIDAKISRAIQEIAPSSFHQKDKKINGHIELETFKTNAQSSFDSANDLIKRKTLIKTAIVKSNSETKIKIGEREMSIADAITEKANIKIKKDFVANLKQKHKTVISAMTENNNKVNSNCQIILEATFGKENVKAGKEDLDAVRKPFMEANEFHLFDPLKIEEKIAAMEKEIGEFELEIDSVLSESNATTMIEI